MTDLLTGFLGIGWGVAAYAVPFLFVFVMVVFFHELGHFLIARLNGVHVEVFSIGMGPEATGWTDRYGTRWKIAWLPLGGYVKMQGEGLLPVAEGGAAGDFQNKGVGARMAITAAGPVANFILSIVIFALLAGLVGLEKTRVQVSGVRDGSPAQAAGFEAGDILEKVGGREVDSFYRVRMGIMGSGEGGVEIEVLRGGDRLVLNAVPRLEESTDRFGNKFKERILGIELTALGDISRERLGLSGALWHGVTQTGFIIRMIGVYLGDLVTGRQGADQLGGPIRIVKMSGDVAGSLGLGALLALAGALSVSLGILNLLPVPLLDGGHLLFYGFEAVRGEPLSERIQVLGMKIGAALLFALMAFVTVNDFIQLNVFG